MLDCWKCPGHAARLVTQFRITDTALPNVCKGQVTRDFYERTGLQYAPPWRQPRGKWVVSLANFHTNATAKRWCMWEIDLTCPELDSRVFFLSLEWSGCPRGWS